MKKGDVVTINDYSYARAVKAGELTGNLTHEYGGYEKYIVIETNCVFPRTCRWRGTNHNDTVVQAVETGEVVFIEERFLRLATHKIIIDGKTIELSNESYKNLKEQLV